MANWFQKLFIGAALTGALSTPAAGQQNSSTGGDKKTDKIETSIKTNKQQQAQQPRIYIKTEDIKANETIPGMWGDDMKSVMAYYSNEYDRIVCINYRISDEIAYQKINGDIKEKDLQTALDKFRGSLREAKYKGKMPKTLADVEQILSNSQQQIAAKKMQQVKNSASILGLTAASAIKKHVEGVNRANTSPVVIRHELQHMLQDKKEEAAGLQYGSFLPGSLLSPQDHLLAEMAKEIEAWCKSGESGCKTLSESMTKFRRERAPKYLEKIFNDVAGSDWFKRETYRHCYAQNLDIRLEREITGSTPIIFGENQSVTVDGKKYSVAQCINETDGSWCYTVPKDDTRDHLPEGTVITDENGKQYEANVLYDKNGKPMTDANGETMHAYGYFDDGWKISICESRPEAVANFSNRNLEKRLNVLFGEKSSQNEFRNLLEQELNFYRNSIEYKRLSIMNNNLEQDIAYINECQASPLSDEFVKKGIKFNNDRINDNMDGYTEITDRFFQQEKAAEHIDHMREVLSAQNMADATATNGEISERQEKTYDMTAYFQTQMGHKR